jgi:hypothetical protein
MADFGKSRCGRFRRRSAGLLVLALGLAAPLGLATPAAGGDIVLPPGFTARVYVTGEGFDRGREGARGVPVAVTLAFDASGTLYLARSGSRYGSGQSEELLTRIYRIPPGGARLTPATEGAHAYGPPLRNPEVGTLTAGGAMLLTTYDPDREIGVLYRMVDGRPALFAGGTPPAGRPAVFKQPEAVVVDPAGALYVADRARGVVVKLDAAGRVADPSYLALPRARMLALDESGHLWAAGDGTAAAPWQDGQGQIWRVGPDGAGRLVFEGSHPAAIAAAPGPALLVAQRHEKKLFLLTPDGRRLELASFPGDLMPRGLAFAPVTPETQRAGIAGDLFLVTFALRTWYLNEVVRISGPFAEFVRQGGQPALTEPEGPEPEAPAPASRRPRPRGRPAP